MKMPVLYCIWAFLLLLAAPAAAEEAGSPTRVSQRVGVEEPEQARPPVDGATGYTVFLRGQPIGREAVTVLRTAAGATTIVSQTRLGPPVNLVTRRAEVRYRADGTPEAVYIEATLNGAEVDLSTTFADGTATTTGTDGGQPLQKTDKVSPDAVPLPNLMFGVYEAVGRRLLNAEPGTEIRAYIVPQLEIPVRLTGVTTQRMQAAGATFDVTRMELVFVQPRGDLDVTIAMDEKGGLVSVNLPAQSLDVVRDDVSSPTARTLLYSNPGDEPAMIPAAGFSLGATLTRPRNAAPKMPAVILLSGSGAPDRDGLALGVPAIGQLAGALADAGFLAVRYDKRGYGQSGGRAESATLGDYAEDARSVFNWLRERPDVDRDRIALVGHSEGAWVALLAASRERRIAGVVAIAAPSTTGAELVLEQQRYVLDQSNAPDRDDKIALQQKINEAVLSGEGWDEIPAAVRKQADTPWFESLLAFDPARVVGDVRRPILLVHGELDRQVPVAHAERLAALAREERRSRAVDVATVPGVNHLLVPAATGHISEYGNLPDRNVSRDVTSAVSAWLAKTFEAVDN